MYRYERSGALSGLSRVRCMTLNDAHIFCTPGSDQGRVLQRDAARRAHLSRSRHHAIQLSPLAARSGKQGEVRRQRRDVGARRARAARGPRLARPTLPREPAATPPSTDQSSISSSPTSWATRRPTPPSRSTSTCPASSTSYYTAADGKQHRPVMIHRAIVSTMERMVSYLIEHYAGNFPALARARAGRPRPHRRTSQ